MGDENSFRHFAFKLSVGVGAIVARLARGIAYKNRQMLTNARMETECLSGFLSCLCAFGVTACPSSIYPTPFQSLLPQDLLVKTHLSIERHSSIRIPSKLLHSLLPILHSRNPGLLLKSINQPPRATIMPPRLPPLIQLLLNPLGQSLPQLNPPLIERINIPDRALQQTSDARSTRSARPASLA